MPKPKIPQLKIDRRRPKIKPLPGGRNLGPGYRVAMTEKGVTAKEIGLGPWTVQNKSATRIEFLVARGLDRLGWSGHYGFQTSFMGGRSVPGGQVLDFVLDDVRTVIDPRSYHHMGAVKEFKDAMKEAAINSSGYRLLTPWEADIDQYRWLDNYLTQEIGARGGR